MAQPDEILVVTATLGRSGWLGEAVESVAAVRAAGFPIRHRIAAPAAEVPALQARFPGCEVVESRAPGVYGALNEAIATAGNWSWMTWLNDDDRWRHDGVLRAFTALRDGGDADIVYGRVDYIDASGKRLGALPVESRPQRFRALMAAGISPLSQHGTFVRRTLAETLGGFDESLRLAADFDYWARAVAAGARFRFVDTVVADFRLRTGQLSGDTAAIRREIAASARNVFPRMPGWRSRVAALAFRLRHAGEILERRRITGRWRSEKLIDRQPARTVGDRSSEIGDRDAPCGGMNSRGGGAVSESLSVVIVTRNHEATIGRVLEGLAAQTEPADRVVVVDCASGDTGWAADWARHPGTGIELSKQNLGFAGGNNRGLRLLGASAGWVLFLNPDVLVPPGLFAQIRRLLAEDRAAGFGAIGVRLMSWDFSSARATGEVDSSGIFPSWSGWRDRREALPAPHDDVEEVPALCGAFFLARVRALKAVALSGDQVWNERYFAYKEDIELSLRLRRAGWKVGVWHGAEAWHGRGWHPDRKRMPRAARLLSARNEIRLHARYAPWKLPVALVKWMVVACFDL